MAGWLAELPVQVRYGREVTGFAQDDAGVDVVLADGETLRAQYLVGCDGGRSLIRKLAGHRVPGLGGDAQQPDRRGRDERSRSSGSGTTPSASRPSARSSGREVVYRRGADRAASSGPATSRRWTTCARRWSRVYGTDFGVHSPIWISRFTDATRQAAAYRAGRVLLAGDAAHIHYPAGGQGLSLGVQDAVNLGWKLAQVVNGTSPEGLLDTYYAERHPVGRPRAAVHDGAGRAPAPRRAHAGAVEVRRGRGGDGRAAQTARRARLRARHPLRPRRGASAARAAHARPGARRRAARLRPPARGAAGAAQLRGAGTAARGASTPPTPASGSFRCSAWSARRPPCSCARTATSPGWETAPTRGWMMRWPPGSDSADAPQRPQHVEKRRPAPLTR